MVNDTCNTSKTDDPLADYKASIEMIIDKRTEQNKNNIETVGLYNFAVGAFMTALSIYYLVRGEPDLSEKASCYVLSLIGLYTALNGAYDISEPDTPYLLTQLALEKLGSEHKKTYSDIVEEWLEILETSNTEDALGRLENAIEEFSITELD